MTQFCSLLILSTLAVARSEFGVISERLLAAKQSVLPGREPLVIFRQKELTQLTEILLIRFLKDLSDSVTVYSRASRYARVHKSTMHSILFIDKVDPDICKILYTNNRRIIVTVIETFYDIPETCDKLNGIFMVYNAVKVPFFHYNHFTRTMHRWDNLQLDPLIAATNDLAGFSFNTESVNPVDLKFLIFLSTHLNGSIRMALDGDMYILNVPMQFTLYYMSAYVPMYMFQNDEVYVFVPRINKPIPLIYIITDPFDIPSWSLILASIFVLSIIRTFITKLHTSRDLMQNMTLVVGSFTVGSQVQYNHEVERLLFGLFLLLSVVLINAYQSLIISYLLSPRFYPELDTLQLINDSCCWDQSEYMSYYNLKRLDKCPEIDMYYNLDSEDLDLVRQAYAATFCTIVDKVQRMVIDHFPYLAKDSGMYRWSKQTINNWPLLAWTNGDPIVLERMLILSRIYYAENALNSIYGKAFSELKEASLESTVKPTTVEDLSLVWMVYVVGLVFSILVFIFEINDLPSLARKTWKVLKAVQFLHGKK